MSSNIAVVDPSSDPRAELRSAHRERDSARGERDRLSEVLERARAELQRLLDRQHEHEAAHAAEVARFVEARTAALLDAGPGVAEGLPRPASTAELAQEIATGRLVEEQVVARQHAAETAVRKAEAQVMTAAIALLVGHGEEVARELEVVEAEAREKRAALAALAGLWAAGRSLPLGRNAVWLLTDGDYRAPEGVTGLRAMRAHQSGYALPREPQPPDWQAILNRLLVDPEAELA